MDSNTPELGAGAGAGCTAPFPEDPEQIMQNTPQSDATAGISQGIPSGRPQGDPRPSQSPSGDADPESCRGKTSFGCKLQVGGGGGLNDDGASSTAKQDASQQSSYYDKQSEGSPISQLGGFAGATNQGPSCDKAQCDGPCDPCEDDTDCNKTSCDNTKTGTCGTACDNKQICDKTTAACQDACDKKAETCAAPKPEPLGPAQPKSHRAKDQVDGTCDPCTAGSSEEPPESEEASKDNPDSGKHTCPQQSGSCSKTQTDGTCEGGGCDSISEDYRGWNEARRRSDCEHITCAGKQPHGIVDVEGPRADSSTIRGGTEPSDDSSRILKPSKERKMSSGHVNPAFDQPCHIAGKPDEDAQRG